MKSLHNNYLTKNITKAVSCDENHIITSFIYVISPENLLQVLSLAY